MKKSYLVIPSLEPKKDFIILLKNVKKRVEGMNIDIIVVNDGSGYRYDEIFNEIKRNNITVLDHFINLGKGRALKTAFNYILNKDHNLDSIVTADSDGQHSIEDIISCLKMSQENPNTLILGVRKFKNTKKTKIPFRSSFGNKLTNTIFKYLLGLNISDTQTGLRAFGKKQAIDFLKVKGERFEYETNMLIDNRDLGYKFKETIIRTIYIENNETSHFNPIRDSIVIYSLFLKYIIVSIFSFLTDIFLFKIFMVFKSSILSSTIIARIISSILNYMLNRNKVFKSYNKTSFSKYYILVFIQMFISGMSVSFLSNTFKNKNILVLKIIVDIVIFIVNYYIQREWVFKKGEK